MQSVRGGIALEPKSWSLSDQPEDRTHITQLLGRMVRTPLARRIPGNERLNSVNCLLPFFDIQSVRNIADAMMSGGDGDDDLPGRRVLVSPQEVTANPAIPETGMGQASLLALPVTAQEAGTPDEAPDPACS